MYGSVGKGYAGIRYNIKDNANKLSKKERKRLEKIVEIKDKKANRQKIFESLALHKPNEKAEKRFLSVLNPEGGGGEEDDMVNPRLLCKMISRLTQLPVAIKKDILAKKNLS